MKKNIKHIQKNKMTVYASLFIFSLLTFFFPTISSAASVYMNASRTSVSVGDTLIVGIIVDSDKTAINSVEGDITLQSAENAFEVKEFSLAGSIFGLWPRTPSLSNGGNVISFVGGVPGGFDLQGARLFNVIVEAKKEGTVRISPRNIVAFANDGKGTKVPVSLKDITITVGPKKAGDVSNDEWGALVAADVTSPEDFVVILGRENSLFEGKRFAFFSAMDGGSGISHYVVSENGKAAVRSGSTYVLQDQSDAAVSLDVTAYDKAGNKKIVHYKSPSFGLFGFSWAFIIIVLLLVAIWYFRRRKAKKRFNA